MVEGRARSIVEITPSQLQRFTVSIKELAEWFGLEVARLVVDGLREVIEWQEAVE